MTQIAGVRAGGRSWARRPASSSSSQRMEEARATIAALLTGDPDDIALTHAVTDGMNIGHQRPGLGRRRSGGRRRGTSIPAGPARSTSSASGTASTCRLPRHRRRRRPSAVIAAFAAAIDDRTKAIVISHVLWSTGRGHAGPRHRRPRPRARRPRRGRRGTERRAPSRSTSTALGADVYAIPGQKWLLGPEGTGRGRGDAGPRAIGCARPFAGFLTFERIDSAGDAAFWSNARRYEGDGLPSAVGRRVRPVGRLVEHVRRPALDLRARHADGAGRSDRLSAIDGVDGHHATARTWRRSSPSASRAGRPGRSRTSWVPASSRSCARSRWLDVVRISVGFFNSEEELERLADVHRAPRRPHARDGPAAADADDPGRGLSAGAARRAGPESASGPGRRSAGASSATRRGPIVRAVMASLVVAVILAIAFVAYDVALARGADTSRR